MPFYRKRSGTIEAVQFDGSNADEITAMFGPGHVRQEINRLVISTLEGDMKANVGDWILKGSADEAYPCRNDVFIRTYERVEG